MVSEYVKHVMLFCDMNQHVQSDLLSSTKTRVSWFLARPSWSCAVYEPSSSGDSWSNSISTRPSALLKLIWRCCRRDDDDDPRWLSNSSKCKDAGLINDKYSYKWVVSSFAGPHVSTGCLVPCSGVPWWVSWHLPLLPEDLSCCFYTGAWTESPPLLCSAPTAWATAAPAYI